MKAAARSLSAAGEQWTAMREAVFAERTAGSPIHRIGHERWLRYIAVALGNALRTTGDAAIAQVLQSRAGHPSALVREHVAWALERQRARAG